MSRSLRFENVHFVTSAGNAQECPPGDLPEVAFSGRSNVGKSTLLNTLVGRRNMAVVSGTPGKTRRLNFFSVDDRFHLVDLPGYGYAKVSASMRAEWSDMMQEYLRHRRQLAAVVQLVDARHPPSPEDREMVRWLMDENMAFAVVATKWDKLRPSGRPAAIETIAGALGIAPDTVLTHSVVTREGRPQLLRWIESVLRGG